MRFLVTGGAGFIGSNFIRYLVSEHDDLRIVNLDRLSYGSTRENLRELENEDAHTFLEGSITDGNTMSELVEDTDFIVNFAAETHVDRSISDPGPFLESNTRGVFTILECLRKNGGNARFVHISTDEVYGDTAKGSFTEESKLEPSNPYSATKAAADMLVLSHCRTYGIDASITRCTNNFGPRQFPEKLVPKTIIRASEGLKVPVYGTGENVRDWIFVRDHCSAVDLVAREGESREVYNISSGHEVRNIELVKKILSIMGKSRDLIEFVGDRPGHDLRYSLDSTKIREELGWEPEAPPDDALEKTVDWYLENEDWWRPLADRETLSPQPWRKG